MKKTNPLSHLARRLSGLLTAVFALALAWSAAAGNPSTTVVTFSANPSTYGNPVTFTATVSGGFGTPTGTVQFKTNGVNFGSAKPLTSGAAASDATLTTPGARWQVGTYTVTAEYSGDAVYDRSNDPLDGGQIVQPWTLNITASALNKVYNGNTTVFVGLFDDALSGDNVFASYTDANAASKNMGSRTVTVTSITLGGADAGNYTPASTTVFTSAQITSATLTYKADAKIRVYQASNTTLTGKVDGYIIGENAGNALVQPATTNWTTTATPTSRAARISIGSLGCRTTQSRSRLGPRRIPTAVRRRD